jgi:DNA-binding transcriptional ArsR family regulator
MGGKEWEPATVFDVFGDGLARRILVLASERPFSAEELASTLDTSLPTVYRRLNSLADYDLITQRQQLDPDGNHFKTYETAVSRLALEIDDGGYNIDIQLRRSLADQFEDFWSELGASSDGSLGGADDRPNAEGTRGDTTHG